MTGTETELPNCLYANLSFGFTMNVSGKPCKRAHSLGVMVYKRRTQICEKQGTTKKKIKDYVVLETNCLDIKKM